MEKAVLGEVIISYIFGLIVTGMLVYGFKTAAQDIPKSCMKYLVLKWLPLFIMLVICFLFITNYGIENGAFGTYSTEEVQTDKKTLKVTTDVENKITTFVESDGTIIYEKSI